MIFLLGSMSIFGQVKSKPNPPAPKRTTVRGDALPPPKVKEISKTKFVSEEGGFKIKFPSQPITQTLPIAASFGKANMTINVLVTSLAEYSISYLDFPTEMTEKYDLDIRYDQARDSQIKRLGGVLKKDSEFYFGSYYGREIVIEGKTTASLKILTVGPGLFFLVVETKGALSSQSGKLKDANNLRIRNFLNSFEITKVPESKLTRKELPADFGLNFADNILTSKVFEVSMKLPEAWTFVSNELGQSIFELGKENIQNRDPKLVAYLTNETARLLAVISKGDPEKELSTAAIYILAERAPYPNFLPKASAESFVKLYLEPTETVIENPKLTKIGGIEFAFLELFDSNTETYSRIYFSNRFGMSFEIKFVYRTTEDLQTMLKSLNTLKQL